MKRKPAAIPTSVGVAASTFGVRSGTGAIVEQFLDALRNAGVPCGITGEPALTGYAPPETIDLPAVSVSFESPHFWRNRRPIGVVTETRGSYNGSYSILFGDASQILCPSAWVRDAVAHRTNRKASLWRFGIDPVFALAERTPNQRFRVLHLSRCSSDYRKGADLAITAFQMAFEGSGDAELVIHSTSPSAFDGGGKNVAQRVGPFPPAALADYYRSFDAVIYSSRAEAFPSVAIEAMACGVPVIHSGATGMSDIADLGFVCAAKPERAPDGADQWMQPDAGDIAERLREIYNGARDEKAAQEIRSRYSWEHAVTKFFRLL